MTCKDCVHFDVCRDATIPNTEYKGPVSDKSKECRHFKNKADFVEVCRCEKCKHSIKSWITPSYDKKQYLCKRTDDYHKPDYFCSYGERRDT